MSVKNKLVTAAQLVRTHFTPVIENTVFFDSFLGQYNDNPKYVSEKLHELAPEIHIVWSTSDKCRETPPSYVQCVTYGTELYRHYAFNSQVTVDNHTGIRTFGLKPYDVKLLHTLIKKKGQLAISTWHGTPLKKIGKDTLHRPVKTFYTAMDYCVAGCTFTAHNVGSAFCIEEKMKLYGTPRNDVFFADSSNASALKKKLKIPPDKGVILFAPTFRDNIKQSGLSQLQDLNLDLLLATLKEQFGKDFVFVFRVHHSVMKKIQESSSNYLNASQFIDGNVGDDMAEYMLCADVLLTDYSSSSFDFALSGKPCFLYAPDLEHYDKEERGLYINFDSLPFPKAINAQELYAEIKMFDAKTYKHDVKEFLIKLGNVEDGHASERIVQDIIVHIKRNLR